MNNLIPAEDRILEIARYLHWWTYFDLYFWFTKDAEKRVWFVEDAVPKLHAKGLLKRKKYGKRNYFSSWSQPSHLVHGIVCTRALLRFWIANTNCSFISENEFREQKLGVVPEWGIIYPSGDLLLCEYCTADNVGRNGLVTRKLNLYNSNLGRIEKSIKAVGNKQALVVFILDTADALDHALQNKGASFAYFIDKDTFFAIKPEKQISARIYISGADGRRYSLTND